jgi:hypothetical protein
MISQPAQQISGIYHREIGDIVVTAVSDGYFDGSLDVMGNVDLDAAHRLMRDAFGPARRTSVDRDTIDFTSFRSAIETCHLEMRAPPARSLGVGADAESSVGSPKNECLSKVVLFGDRHRMTPSRSERNHQEKSSILLLRQIAEVRCEEAARCRERLGDLSLFYHQDAA